MTNEEQQERRGGPDRDQRVQQDARLDDQAAQLSAVQDRVTQLESRLQDSASLAERLTALEDQAGRLAQAQEDLAASQARIATLETQVLQLQQGAEQAQERITEMERRAGELTTARLRIAEMERRLQPLEVAQTQPGLLERLFRRE
jgi:chromosome segregation ATPase